MANCNVGTKLSYLLAGMGIGAVIALLFAPQSGQRTRRQIVEKAQNGKDFVSAKTREIRRQAENLVDQGKDLLNKQKARLAEAMESGKEAARQTLTQ